MIRDMLPGDAPRVLAIYEQAIETRSSSFESVVPTWEKWNTKYLGHSRLVYESPADGRVCGWAALAPFSNRDAYLGVAELSIYVDLGCGRKGIGSTLMEALVDSAEANGIWTLCANILPENSASIALHRKYGFRSVGIRERVGYLAGRWHDMLIMERRSMTVGIAESA